ncbi:MAG: T9SS C-terminal target domain-containing protein [Cytophagales bacterium]|nr:MAG: T9SS C-terminal target domain-containing protein [Cytophagales bacterium]
MKRYWNKLCLLLSIQLIVLGNTYSQKTVEAELSSGVFNIDGILNESQWNINQSIGNKINATNLDCIASTPANTNILESKFGVFSTKNYLYIGMKIYDDVITVNDAAQIFVSASNIRNTNCPNNWPRAYSATDFQLIVQMSTGEVNSPNGMSNVVDAVAMKQNEDHYTLEMRLIWAEVDFLLSNNTTVSINREIGFDIGYNDSDLPNSTQNLTEISQIMWNNCCNNRNWTETINFGTIKLVDNVIDSISWELDAPIQSMPTPLVRKDSLITFKNPDGSINTDFLSVYTGKILSVAKVSEPITIDGKIEESAWRLNNQVTNRIQIDNLNCESTSQSLAPSRINANFGVLWDNNRLYFAVKCTDAEIKENDNVSIFLSMDNDRSSNCPYNWPRVYSESTSQITVNIKSKSINGTNSPETFVDKLAISQTEGGYILELSLIWDELDFFTGAKPTIDRFIGFDISVNDFDNPNPVLNLENSTILMWNQCCSNRNWTEATNFGLIRLRPERQAQFSGLDNILSVKSTSNTSNNFAFNVFPNPNNGIFKVNNIAGAEKLRLVNVYGVNVLSLNIENLAEINVETSNLPSGNYWVEISGKTGISRKSLVISQ